MKMIILIEMVLKVRVILRYSVVEKKIKNKRMIILYLYIKKLLKIFVNCLEYL